MVRRSSATPTDAEAAAPKGASNDDDPAPYIALVDEMRRDASITGAEATLLVRTGGDVCRAWVHAAAAAAVYMRACGGGEGAPSVTLFCALLCAAPPVPCQRPDVPRRVGRVPGRPGPCGAQGHPGTHRGAGEGAVDAEPPAPRGHPAAPARDGAPERAPGHGAGGHRVQRPPVHGAGRRRRGGVHEQPRQ